MKKSKIFIACDTTNISKIKKIIKDTKSNKIKVGYKFGLEFLNSKNGRQYISKLKNKITFGDYKISDIPNTCASTIKAIKDLKFNYDGSWKSHPTFLEKIKYEPYDIFEVEHYLLSVINVTNRYL